LPTRLSKRRPGKDADLEPSDANSLREGAFHSNDSSLLHAQQHVTVGVHRLRDGYVTQHLLNYFQVGTLGEQERREGVT
jgi:hypothetical protein